MRLALRLGKPGGIHDPLDRVLVDRRLTAPARTNPRKRVRPPPGLACRIASSCMWLWEMAAAMQASRITVAQARILMIKAMCDFV